MKKITLFKILLDVLCFFFLLWFIAFIAIVPTGKTTFNHITIAIENWNLFYWSISIVSLITFIIFIRGLYYLRKVVRLLSKKYFSDINITNSKKVGVHFLIAGVLYSSIIIILWLNKSIKTGEFEIGTDMDLIAPLTLMIIGVFFIIHSKNLLLAKSFKDENELTV